MKPFPLFLASLAIAAAIVLLAVPVLAQTPTTSPLPTPVPTVEPVPTPPQFPTEPPDTAADTIPYLRYVLVFISAIIGVHVTNLVKKIPWLGGQGWFLKLVKELVAGVTEAVVAFIIGNAVMLAGYLDATGLWALVIWVWPIAFGLYHTKRISHNAAYATRH